MGANVFANGREVSAEKSDDQSPGAMPDVCLSPPSPPAGPLPLPYPNFSKASDMTDGTKTVKIAGGQAGMKDQSNYKTSKGDEAATRNFGMGVVSHSIQGTTFFSAWSSDVMFEGANAVRFMDMTTHNHGSQANPPSAIVSTGEPTPPEFTQDKCEELKEKNEKSRQAMAQDERKYAQEIGTESTTITHGVYKLPGGQLQDIQACSRKLATSYDSKFVQGLESDEVAAGKTNMCEGANFKYAKAFRPPTSHTESRILEHILGDPIKAPAGTAVLLKINWKKGSQIDDGPCEHCRRLICAAVQDCKLNIKLCQGEENKPTEPDCPPKSQ